MDPRIQNVLEHAILAPSGDNCQPWKITVEGMRVDLFNDPERDNSLYNLQQRASLIAHGAFLENLSLAAPTVGLTCRIELFPDPGQADRIARVHFAEGETTVPPLFEAISRRQTNRERYQPVKISDSQVAAWQNLADPSGPAVWICHQRQQIDDLAASLSWNDRLVFEVFDLHRFLFEQVRWSDAEAGRTGDGLDLKTLGLNRLDRWSFRFLQHWQLVAVLNKLGFAKIIQMKARQNLKSASAVAMLTIPETLPIHYVAGGRLWQRLLLQAASEGLTAQPVAGLACLLQAERDGLLRDNLDEAQRRQLAEIRGTLADYHGAAEDAAILGLFRIGKARPVTRALRRPFNSFLTSRRCE